MIIEFGVLHFPAILNDMIEENGKVTNLVGAVEERVLGRDTEFAQNGWL